MSERATIASRLALAIALAASPALAADAGASAPGKAAAAPSVRPTDRAAASPHGDSEGEALDPHGQGADPHGQGADPHGQGATGHGGADGMFQAPEDGSIDDPTLPTGTLEIHIVDPTGKPLASTPVTLGVLYNSVAKGESRKRLFATTNEKGVARLDHLETGSTVAYRPMVMTDGATFSVMPFRLSDSAGTKAILHVYPVVEDIESALVVSQSIIYAEVKDDRIQIQQAFKIYNFGKTAWVPKDLVVALPEAFTAFTTQQGMSDIGADAVPKQGVRIHGTFGPGQHAIEFRWQLPYAGESDVRFDVGMIPRTAAARVIAPSSKDMKLDVPGFPTPQSTSDGSGQRALITERQIRKEDPPLKGVEVVIQGLPTEGPAKIIATLMSAATLAFGIGLGAKKLTSADRQTERQRLLDELENLERARRAGDVGPKTYERAWGELVDAIARTFAGETPTVRKRSRST